MAAIGTNRVRRDRVAALDAELEFLRFLGILRAAFTGSRVAVFPLWNGHGITLPSKTGPLGPDSLNL